MLANSKMSDAGLAQLKGLTRLNYLNLDSNPGITRRRSGPCGRLDRIAVTDAVEYKSDRPGPDPSEEADQAHQFVRLIGTGVTDAGLENLWPASPPCKP